MHIMRSVRLILANALRVVHIALWLTIPTAMWLWLIWEETPTDCVPKFAGYEGNALCISDFGFLWIVVGMFLLGAIVFGCWIVGYGFETCPRSFAGDDRLPPLGSGYIVAGFVFICVSLRFWLPFIAAAVAAHEIRSSLYPRDFGNPALDMLLLAVTLVIFCGYLAGIARFIAGGDLSLIWRRLENIDLALSQAGHSLLLALSLFLVAKIGILVWARLVQHVQVSEGIDLLLEAVVSSFAFYFLLLCWSITCSYLVALYARKIGIGDNLKDGERLRYKRLTGFSAPNNVC